MILDPDDLAELRRARALLQDNNLAVRITGLLGGQVNRGIDFLLRRLPPEARERMHEVAQQTAARALEQGYRAALGAVAAERGLAEEGVSDGSAARRRAWLNRRLASPWFDKAATAMTGFAGGAGGLAGTAVELPVTTTILLRAIAQIAANEGEDVRSDDCRIECVKVLAFGAPSVEEDAGYWAVRLALAETIRTAAGRTVGELMPRLFAQVAPRFGVNATWKFAGQAVPLAGAATGVLMNLAFTGHYQDKARGHFVIRRLEREYGETAVREAYEAQ